MVVLLLEINLLKYYPFTDVVQGDLKSTMRVLYALFNKYKSTVTSQSEPTPEK